jgi:hypothetical protein
VAGDILYVSDITPGTPTATPPLTPNLTQEIGTVLVKSATEGSIQIFIRSLEGDEFGTINNFTVADGQFFIGDGSYLYNVNISEDYAKYQFTNNNFNGSGNFTGSYVNPTSLINGSVVFYDGSNLAQDNSNLFWDNVNKRLGIGTVSPATELDVRGQMFVRASADSQTVSEVQNFAANQVFSVTTDSDGDGILYVRNKDGTIKNSISSVGDSYFLGGNVGIGTASPTEKLDVRGKYSQRPAADEAAVWQITTAGNALRARIDTTGGDASFLLRDNSNDYTIQLRSSGTTLLNGGNVIFNGGDVGIGTTSPTHKLNVVGNANITGNITSSNVFIPQYMFSHTNATISVKGVGVWTNVTFDQEDSDIKQGISHTFNDNTNHTFTIKEDGIYNVDYDLDVQDTSAGASDINVAGRLILVNGTEIKGSVFEIDITKQGTEAELSHNFLVKALAGQKFIVQFTASDADVQISTHGTYGDYPESASLLINKIANI